MNSVNRYELFTIQDGEKQVEITEDTKIPNAATVTINKRDHTLANLLRSQLLSMPSVLFAGYKVPHPLTPSFQLKIQTDGAITPAAALEEAATKLIGTLAGLENKFRREFSFKEHDGGMGGGLGMGVDGDGLGSGLGSMGYGGESAWTGRDYLDL